MKKPKLKPISEQVIVITGASSGIGLATARLAAERGAKVVLAARSEEVGAEIADQLSVGRGKAIFIPCDVSDRDQVERLAAETIERFGRIDTWVNNAGVSIYGRLEEVSVEESRRLFDTNFWGVYHGCLAALPHLRRNGGALINVGSEVSEAVIGFQGMYAASKHAVKGLTDALRVEVQHIDEAPVSITLIQPGATDTPFPQHARNHMPREPKLPTPLDNPVDVAEAILNAAVKPIRSKKVSALAKINTTTAKVAPGLGDKMAAMQAHRQQYKEPPRNPEGALEEASENVDGAGGERGSGGRTR
ncbi:MAG TPA: SDR family oxidoreductase [Methylomirabilota bacterium]|nr:SDR family oxidoreductase [Methylomirabilota bacterium]